MLFIRTKEKKQRKVIGFRLASINDVTGVCTMQGNTIEDLDKLSLTIITSNKFLKSNLNKFRTLELTIGKIKTKL